MAIHKHHTDPTNLTVPHRFKIFAKKCVHTRSLSLKFFLKTLNPFMKQMRIGESDLVETQIQKMVIQAHKQMNEGNYEGALNTASKIKELELNDYTYHVLGGLLIDLGWELKREAITVEGIEIIQKNLEILTKDPENVPEVYYNLANGFYVLFQFARLRDDNYAFFRKTDLDEARTYYRKALQYFQSDNNPNALIVSQIWVNIGNCYDSLGRVIDALECYEEALKVKPDHGMALCNKGIALYFYALVSGEHEGIYMKDAYCLLSKGLKAGVIPESALHFSNYLLDIKKRFKNNESLNEQIDFPGYVIKSDMEIERFLVKFCLEKKLFLNACNFCQKCDAAIGDTAVIRKMIETKQDADPASPRGTKTFRLLSYLDQIKQDYVTTRFLLILSAYKKLDIDFVYRNVTLADIPDGSVNDIRAQLTKTAFKCFYDILDKVACFINDYLKLGINERDVSFGSIWTSKLKNKEVNEKITETLNPSLNALFDIHRGLMKGGPYYELQKTRNALTHRFVNIRPSVKSENEENMTQETLNERTLELAKLVRNAIIYLVYFVFLQENRKEQRAKEKTTKD